jgi:hypothetical protein
LLANSLKLRFAAEDQRAASDMREKSETPDDDTSETPRGMIDN